MLRSGLTLLTLSLALPGTAWSLGLGDIHISSALHQRLVAQIDLVGATDDELPKLSGGIASEEIFQRYGLERPAFLNGTTLVVERDKQGRPTLILKSAEPFTEPVVTFLVDVHSPGGQLIREYTVLLDPPGFADGAAPAPVETATPRDASVPVSAAGANEGAVAEGSADASRGATSGRTASQRPATHGPATHGSATADSAGTAPAPFAGKTYTIAPRDTLDRIVRKSGVRARADRHRMMVAIFRANPSAFRSNLNLLRVGATLHIPSSQELSALSAEDAKREYDAHMAAWRAGDHRGPSVPAPATGASPVTSAPAAPTTTTSTGSAMATSSTPATATSSTPATPVSPASAPISAGAAPESGTAPEVTDNAVLAQRVEYLEKSLAKIRAELAQPPVTRAPPSPASSVDSTAASDASSASDADESEDEAPPTPWYEKRSNLLIAGLIAAIGAGAYAFRRMRGSATPNQPRKEQFAQATGDSSAAKSLEFDTATRPFIDAALANPPSFEKIQSGPAPAARSATSNGTSDASNAVGAPAASGESKPSSESNWFKESFSTPIGDLLANELAAKLGETPTAEMPAEMPAKMARAAEMDPGKTVEMDAAEWASEVLTPVVETKGSTAEQKFGFYNPESTNTTHVILDSGLKEPAPFVERRKNPADVLRQAIEREPERSDLRLKLLELYYTAAEQNRRAFLEATHQLAKNEKLASPEDWSRIADMGRTIAPDDELFTDQPKKGKQVA